MAAAVPKKVFEVFVSKIPWTIAMKEVREYFGQFGQVKKCLLPFDKETGFHRGFCWKDPHTLEGAKIQVQKNRRSFAAVKTNKDSDDSVHV
uniref:SRA stem-loop interacting RNA binding protein n=1 Tax=Gadus morhua TaxID=8049 RepID=A0A8C5CQ59_GADMO